MREFAATVFLGFLISLRAFSASDQEKEEQQAQVGKPAPKIEARKWVNGEPVELEKQKGKLVLLHFFAQWCGPCREDYPKLAELEKKKPGDKLTIVCIHAAAPDKDIEKIQEVLKKYELTSPVALDAPIVARYLGKTHSSYKTHSIPHAVLIDEEGKIVVHGDLSEAIQEADKRLGLKAISSPPEKAPSTP